MLHSIHNWDAVYDNQDNIPFGDKWPGLWVEPARAFREKLSSAGRARLGLTYGDGERNRFDLFLPEGEPKGLVIFVHGGFWMGLDRSFWSHLAAGSLAHGYAFAVPEYTLCPNIRISGITVEIAAAITAAAQAVPGPIHLAGHSAGGHLVTRMVSNTSPLPDDIQKRIGRVASLSGLHDLRPLRHYWRQRVLSIDEDEARRESPALLEPVEGAVVLCWAGARETSEFLRQSALLANIWRGLGAATASEVEPDRHHFNIVDILSDPDHPLVRDLLG